MKNRKKLLAVLATTITLIGYCTPLQAAELDVQNITLSDWITPDGSYQYPVTAKDDAWNMFCSAIDMREASQIHEDLLETISTEELIELVLEYPLLCDINAYPSVRTGYEQIKDQFNGIPELLSRPDCYEKLLDAYNNFSIPEEKIIDYDELLSDESYEADFNALLEDDDYVTLILEHGSIYNKLAVLEMLLADCLDNNVNTTSDTNLFVQSYKNKLVEKENSEYFNDGSSTSLVDLLIEEDSVLANELEPALTTYSANASSYVLTTPSGTVVANTSSNYRYTEALELCSADSFADDIVTYNATLISRASKTFNCHSYAWLSSTHRDAYQHIWLNVTGPFERDPYYSSESTPTATGRIATWTGHSGLITGLNEYNPISQRPEPYMISKWSDGPIVGHCITACSFFPEGSSLDIVTYYYH